MLTSQERRNVLALASIFSFRMLGLFMILPVLSLYLHHLQGATQGLIGLALGIYGLFQALLQMPFGLLSDRWGRKPIIFLGLGLFVIGSVVAALAHSIWGIIIGRALQGTGAVGSTILALMADITKVEHRTQAMATVGMMIGLAFIGAMVLGPVGNHWVGLSGLFWATAGLASIGIVVLLAWVPNPKRLVHHRDIEAVPTQIKHVLKRPELLRLDGGIFASHAVLTALFISLPLILRHDINLAPAKQAYFYLPLAVPAFLAMVPFIIIAEKQRRMKQIYTLMIGVLLVSNVMIGVLNQWIVGVAIGLFGFFLAFSSLEALLPSLISKVCPPAYKGTAMGVYSSSQFLGIFAGGAIGGLFYQSLGMTGLFSFSAVLLLLWLAAAMTMDSPPYLSTRTLDVSHLADNDQQQLRHQVMSLSGVHEIDILSDTGVAYIKVDNKILDDEKIDQVIKQFQC